MKVPSDRANMADATQFPSFLDVRTSSSLMKTTPETSEPICPSWLPTNHVYFQIANIFLLLSYLTPPGPYGLLFLRGVIGAGSFFFVLWGYVIMCAWDTLAWNALFTLISLVHGCVLAYSLRPVSLTAEMETVFKALFEPLGVSRRQFQRIVACVSKTRDLEPRQKLAGVENVNTTNDNLSLVVSGKLLLFENGSLVRHVGQYEFVESPEWFDNAESDVQQATVVVADGDCRLMVWNREKLKGAVGGDPFLRAAFYNLLGKDLARKVNAAKKSRAARPLSASLDPPGFVENVMCSKL